MDYLDRLDDNYLQDNSKRAADSLESDLLQIIDDTSINPSLLADKLDKIHYVVPERKSHAFQAR
jgi:GTP-binding protein EngB required for normal cell division